MYMKSHSSSCVSVQSNRRFSATQRYLTQRLVQSGRFIRHDLTDCLSFNLRSQHTDLIFYIMQMNEEEEDAFIHFTARHFHKMTLSDAGVCN